MFYPNSYNSRLLDSIEKNKMKQIQKEEVMEKQPINLYGALNGGASTGGALTGGFLQFLLPAILPSVIEGVSSLFKASGMSAGSMKKAGAMEFKKEYVMGDRVIPKQVAKQLGLDKDKKNKKYVMGNRVLPEEMVKELGLDKNKEVEVELKVEGGCMDCKLENKKNKNKLLLKQQMPVSQMSGMSAGGMSAGQSMFGRVIGGAKKVNKKVNKKMNKRAEIVKKVMKEKNMSMIEASKYVKENNLY